MTASEKLKEIEELLEDRFFVDNSNADEVEEKIAWLIKRAKNVTGALERAKEDLHIEFCSAEHHPVCDQARKALEDGE